jgi:hypothetical protein
MTVQKPPSGACCAPAPPEVRQDTGCTWPDTDCHDNGPRRAEECEGQCQFAQHVGLMEPRCATECLWLTTFQKAGYRTTAPGRPE